MIQYVRFSTPKAGPQYGIIKEFHFSKGEGAQVLALKVSPFESGFENPKPSGETFFLSKLRLLAPVAPSKIIGIGLNYKDHALEQKKPLPEIPYVFLKPPSAIIATHEPIRISQHCSDTVHHEAELVVMIGKTCSRVSEDQALEYVAGYTIGNDVTDRVIQKQELTFARAKGMDTFAPLGPFLVHGIDWRGRRVKAWVNDELRQNGTTDDMIHSVPKIISYVSQFMTLLPGDIIFTGTPAGVGSIKSGDRVKIEIDGLGVLENSVEHVHDAD